MDFVEVTREVLNDFEAETVSGRYSEADDASRRRFNSPEQRHHHAPGFEKSHQQSNSGGIPLVDARMFGVQPARFNSRNQ